MIVSSSDDEEANRDGESNTAKRVTTMTERVESESKRVIKMSMILTPPNF